MRRATIYRDGALNDAGPGNELDAARESSGSFLWLDILSPDDADIALLRDGFAFHPLAMEDAIRDEQRAKIGRAHV